MKLFDEKERPAFTKPSSVLSGYRHLDSYGTPEAHQLREKLESWFRKFPASSQIDVRRRFQSKAPGTHQGALFEIFLHQLLSALGCTVEVHPKIPGSDNKPDFLVRQGNKRFYLEATSVGKASGPFAISSSKKEVIDKLRTLTSPNFNLGFEMKGTLSGTLRGNRLLPVFQELLETHDPDRVQEQIEEGGLTAAPSAKCEADDWCVEAWLIPISDRSRIPGQSRKITVTPLKAAFTNALDPVRNALREKGSNYGQPKLPLVVAVHTSDIFYNGRRCNDMEVLFGNECILSSPETSELSRIPNGIWSGGHGQRIAAFWRFQRVDVLNLAYACGCLYVNPNLNSSILPDALFRLPHGKLVQDKMEWFGDTNIWQLLCENNF